MAVTEVSQQGWISRLGGAFKGVITGLILFIAGFPVLFLNEGRAVKTAKALDEGAAKVVAVDAAKVDPANEGRLVHVSGRATTAETLTDSLCGVSAAAIRLERVVEMYQWEEEVQTRTEKKLGGGEETVKVYTYKKGWSEHPVESARFKEVGYENPGEFPCEGQVFTAKDVKVGAFALSEGQIRAIGGAAAYDLPVDAKAPVLFGQTMIRTANGFYLGCRRPAAAPAPAAGSPLAAAAQPAAGGSPLAAAAPATNGLVTGVAVAPSASAAPAVAEVGDIRISYRVVLPHEVSVVAVQKGGTFAAFTASNGRTIQLLEDGVHTAEEMFASAKQSNAVLTWVLRVVGFLLMYIGLGMVLRPLVVLGDVVPFIGSLLGFGAGVVSFLIALPCALVTIAAAWLAYRPVIGVALVAVAGGLVCYLVTRRRKGTAPTDAKPAA